MPLFNDRTGETKVMRCGMKATIINYNNSHDITIQFEDGTISEHRYYGDFAKGKIENPQNLPDYNERIGEHRTMNCGLDATIIDYKKSNDIVVQFEDGTIVKNRAYQDFLRGEIIHPKLKKNESTMIGITKEMHCGMKARIIAYRKSNDIDIQFEDGVIVYSCSLSAFNGLRVLHPKYKAIKSSPVNHQTNSIGVNIIGETKMMHCGMKATVVAYRTSKDIDVQFENGEIATRKSYSNFQRGAISYPSLMEMTNRIGETKIMNCGLNATIISYRSSKDIDVQFEDGTIAENKAYGNFIKGRIEHPDIKPSASYPERVIAGFLKAADIPFVAEWSDPKLRGDNMKKPLYFDFAILDDQSNVCILIEYQGMQHFKEIGVFGGKTSFSRQQKYDKKKREYAAQREVPLIEIPCDIYTLEDIVNYLNDSLSKYIYLTSKYSFPVPLDKISVLDLNIARIGESKKMQCGLSAKIIAYRSSADIDVEFEDKTIIQGVSYRRFCLGEVIPDKLKYKNKIADRRLGETKEMKCGMNATIIRYGNAFDIDIVFEDGTVRTNQNYSNFSTGQIGNPNIEDKRMEEERIGLTQMMKCGMNATIIAYRKSDDIDVRFENGEIAVGKTFNNFRRGAIAFPSLMNTQYRLGETKKMKCGMTATITNYHSSSNIDICFEDGTMLYNKTYDAFRKGEILNPTIYASRLNETKRMNCGMIAEIITYRKYSDIDVRFEDGTIVQHRSYGDFKKAAISPVHNKKKKVLKR